MRNLKDTGNFGSNTNFTPGTNRDLLLITKLVDCAKFAVVAILYGEWG